MGERKLSSDRKMKNFFTNRYERKFSTAQNEIFCPLDSEGKGNSMKDKKLSFKIRFPVQRNMKGL